MTTADLGTAKGEFVVQRCVKSKSPTWLSITISAVIVLLLTMGFTRLQHDISPWMVVISASLILILLHLFTSFPGRKQTKQSTLTVYEHGVHVSASNDVIPQQDIIDVVVHEIVLSYRVLSVVLLRVSRSSSITEGQTIYDLLSQNKVRLVPAFPGVELSYRDCLKMRDEISKALGLD
jgi:hypothetical protein